MVYRNSDRPDREYHYRDGDYFVTIERYNIGEAYPRNGNLHNPTQYYKWRAVFVDRAGNEEYTYHCSTRREAWEAYKRRTSAYHPQMWTKTKQDMSTAYVGVTEVD